MVNVNGRISSDNEAVIPVFDHGFTYLETVVDQPIAQPAREWAGVFARGCIVASRRHKPRSDEANVVAHKAIVPTVARDQRRAGRGAPGNW